MSGMYGHTPIGLAKDCQEMAKAAGKQGEAFQKGAMVLMGVMVMASAISALLELKRELSKREHHGHGR
ncbi:hypothetical protein [Fimbriiglobus ruber]|nr:hypothetical protein [Fimbriiglobus ruber]